MGLLALLKNTYARVTEASGKIEASTLVTIPESLDARIGRLIDIQKELDLRKQLFAEYDAIVLSLAQEGFTEAFVEDIALLLKDNFASKNTGFTTAAIKRYEIEIITKDLYERRKQKKALQ